MSKNSAKKLENLQADVFSPAVAAYLGDAVYELLVRRWVIESLAAENTLTPKALHQATIARVKASYQADLLLVIDDVLTDGEKDWVRRGKNTSSKTARKQDQAIHRCATALEVLVGWWSVFSPERLDLLKPYWCYTDLKSQIAKDTRFNVD